MVRKAARHEHEEQLDESCDQPAQGAGQQPREDGPVQRVLDDDHASLHVDHGRNGRDRVRAEKGNVATALGLDLTT